MKHLFSLLFIFFLNLESSAKSKVTAYQFQYIDKIFYVTFHHYPKNNLLINSSCLENGKPSCQLSKLKDQLSSFKFHKDDLKGGKNPGSVLCSKALSGNVHRAKKIDSGVNKTFCHLESGAMINLDGLYFLYYYKGENPWL